MLGTCCDFGVLWLPGLTLVFLFLACGSWVWVVVALRRFGAFCDGVMVFCGWSRMRLVGRFGGLGLVLLGLDIVGFGFLCGVLYTVLDRCFGWGLLSRQLVSSGRP